MTSKFPSNKALNKGKWMFFPSIESLNFGEGKILWVHEGSNAIRYQSLVHVVVKLFRCVQNLSGAIRDLTCRGWVNLSLLGLMFEDVVVHNSLFIIYFL